MTARIIGTGRAVPAEIITNDDLSRIVETNDEWISSRTGIRQRRIAKEETTAGLAAEAARKALEQSGKAPEEIQLVIVATCSSDYFFPNTACLVAKELGIRHAAGFDLSAACTGFLYAMNTAQAYMAAGMYENALIIGVETISKLVDWKDRSTCVLFGDGAGAAVLEAADTGFIGMVQHSDGEKADVLTCRTREMNNLLVSGDPALDYIKMEGQEVFKFAVKKVPECVEELLEKTGVSKEEIRYYILHQANSRIISSVAKRLKVEEDRFPMNVNLYGNTSAASIPILLDEMNRDGRLQKGDKLLLSGFGAGLTWGAALVEW